MATIRSYLDKVKIFIEEILEEEDYKLPKAPPMGQQGADLQEVLPVVIYGNLPHANFGLYGADQRFFQAPYIMIGFEECDFDYEEETIPILIQVCCYSTEPYIKDQTQEEYDLKVPDNLGVLDVLNLLEFIKKEVINKADFSVDKPIKIGSYNTKELTYPYAFGYMSFTIKTNDGAVNKKQFNYL